MFVVAYWPVLQGLSPPTQRVVKPHPSPLSRQLASLSGFLLPVTDAPTATRSATGSSGHAVHSRAHSVVRYPNTGCSFLCFLFQFLLAFITSLS